MGDYLGLIWTNLMAYVFGNYVYFGTFLLIAVTVLMYRLNLPIDAMIVAWLPIIYMMTWSSFGISSTWVMVAVYFLLGFVMFLVGKKMSGR